MLTDINEGMHSGDTGTNSEDVQSVNPNQSSQRTRLSVPSFYSGSVSDNPESFMDHSEEEYD